MESGPGGMFWTKERHRAPPGTPRKSGFSARKSPKEGERVGLGHERVGEIPRLEEAPADLKYVVSFPRYGHLKLEFVLEQV